MYGGVNFNADSTEMKSAARSYQLNAEKSLAFRGFYFGADAWPDLPFSEMEIDSIANNARKQNYDVILFKGVLANEESAKTFTGKRSPAVLHFATHGKFFSDPVKTRSGESLAGGKIFGQSENPLFRSTLLLAGANNTWLGKPVTGIEDGVLTAYEISNMYLPNTKLVVLSACETGLGDIQGSEGVYGLQRAFKIAGVQNLVMSLWSVPDNTTAEFMKLFYHYLFENKSISEAFNFSQTAMRNKYRSQPHKWAGLVLIQ
jgi:CHAT domain-containing protein